MIPNIKLHYSNLVSIIYANYPSLSADSDNSGFGGKLLQLLRKGNDPTMNCLACSIHEINSLVLHFQADLP